MGRLEAQAVSFNPQKPNETIYRPDGSRVTTKAKPTRQEVSVRLSHAALAEASHVVIAIDKGVPVKRAAAAEDTGVTELGWMDDTVGAGHIDEGGAGFDMWVLWRRGADIPGEKRRANAIKEKRSEHRIRIAQRLALQGSATGGEMLQDFEDVEMDKRYGKEVDFEVSVIHTDGTEQRLQTRAREKNATVMIPGEWVTPQAKETGKGRTEIDMGVIRQTQAFIDAEAARDEEQKASIRAELAAMAA